MLLPFRNLLNEIIDLIYPRTCASCIASPPVRGGIFCLACLTELPETGYHTMRGNPFEMHFWGRVRIEAGAAFLFFIPHGKTQVLLHHIKYSGRSDFARIIGRFYGEKLKLDPVFASVDCILPVPLHPKKFRKRGFNQSAEFGHGLADALGVPCIAKGIRRTRHTETQTRKSRAERVDNLRDAFVVPKPLRFQGKHILIVDDVLTTGATLEACALACQDISGIRISMATIACGRL